MGFAIGGYGYSDYLDSVEVLNVDDIANVESNEWVLLADTLQRGLSRHRAVSHGRDILTVGGYNDYYPVQVMNVIDTVDLVIYQSGSLDIGLYYTAAVVVDSMAYCFGERDSSASLYIDSWRFLDFPTAQPTREPSTVPTAPPSIEPTSLPSVGPTGPPSTSNDADKLFSCVHFLVFVFFYLFL